MKRNQLRFILYCLMLGLITISMVASTGCSCNPSPAPAAAGALSASSTSATSAASTTVGTTYQNTTWKYSIQVLPGYTVNSAVPKSIYILSGDQRADILITVGASTANLDTYTGTAVQVFKSRYPDYKEQSRNSIKAAGGTSANFISLTYTRDGVAVQGYMLITMKNDNGYVAVGATPPADWSKSGKDLETMIKSLKPD